MYAKQLLVTPEMATEFLSRNNINRKVKSHLVKKYARDMANGRWHSTGDTLQFSVAGKVLEGQHRLHAIIQANTPINMICVYDIDEAAMKVLGTGSPRSTADVLGMYGVANATRIGAAARLLFHYHNGQFNAQLFMSNGTSAGVNPTAADIAELVESTTPDLARSLAALRISGKLLFKLLPPALAIFTHYQWCRLYAPEIVTEFYMVLGDKLAVGESCAALVLRKRLTENMIAKTKLSNVETAAFLLKAFRAFRLHTPTKLLRYASDEKFPTL